MPPFEDGNSKGDAECDDCDNRLHASAICTLPKGHEGMHFDSENPSTGRWQWTREKQERRSARTTNG